MRRSEMRQRVFERSFFSEPAVDPSDLPHEESLEAGTAAENVGSEPYSDDVLLNPISEEEGSEPTVTKRSEEIDALTRAGVLYATGSSSLTDPDLAYYGNHKKISMSSTYVPPSLFSPNNVRKVRLWL